MNWQSFLAAVAILSVATAGGGAAIRLGATLGATGVVATVGLVAALVLAAVGLTVASLDRPSTPYW